MSRLGEIRAERTAYKSLASLGGALSAFSGFATYQFYTWLPKAYEWYENIDEYSQGPNVEIGPVEMSRRTALELFASTPTSIKMGLVFFGAATVLGLGITGYSLYKLLKQKNN